MEENSLEQLETTNANVNEQIMEKKEGGEESSSNLGKFKDTTSLLNAYNSLQKEFTRKSQLLAETKKLYEDLKTQNDNAQSEIQTQNNQIAEENLNMVKDERPQFLTKKWRRDVSVFLENNPDAKKYAKEISNILIGDSKLASLENCLEYAYKIASHSKPVDLNDSKQIRLLAENEEIKKTVIEDYLRRAASGKSSLKFISGEPSSVNLTPTKDKPKTIEDASKILKRLLQS